MSEHSRRGAKPEDLNFLFKVSTEAMLPVRKANNPDLVIDEEKELKEYEKKFVPEKIEIIQVNGEDVGRLRVVRSDDEIYIGGIQILPEYQGQGVGESVMKELIDEADEKNIPITLEVAAVNEGAQRFYSRLGFEKVGEEKTDWIMKYNPNKSE